MAFDPGEIAASVVAAISAAQAARLPLQDCRCRTLSQGIPELEPLGEHYHSFALSRHDLLTDLVSLDVDLINDVVPIAGSNAPSAVAGGTPAATGSYLAIANLRSEPKRIRA